MRISRRRSSVVAALTISSSLLGEPWQNKTCPTPSTSTIRCSAKEASRSRCSRSILEAAYAATLRGVCHVDRVSVRSGVVGGDDLPIGIASDEADALPERHQAVQDLGGHRTS